MTSQELSHIDDISIALDEPEIATERQKPKQHLVLTRLHLSWWSQDQITIVLQIWSNHTNSRTESKNQLLFLFGDNV